MDLEWLKSLETHRQVLHDKQLTRTLKSEYSIYFCYVILLYGFYPLNVYYFAVFMTSLSNIQLLLSLQEHTGYL